MDDESEQLHAVMARATDGVPGVRMDVPRMLRARRKHRWQQGGAAAGVLSIALAVGGFTLHHGGSDGGPAPAPPNAGPPSTSAHPVPSYPTQSPTTVVPVAGEVYDAYDGTEGKDTLAAFMKGKGPWLTRTYCQARPTVDGRPKPGTGLVLDLGAPTPLGGVGFDGTWDTVEIWAADPSVTAMPAVDRFAPPAGFHKVATMNGTSGKFPKFSATTRFLLVWYTELPTSTTGTSDITCANGSTARFRGETYGITIFRG